MNREALHTAVSNYCISNFSKEDEAELLAAFPANTIVDVMNRLSIAEKLARTLLWIAYVYNDHNFQLCPKQYAVEAAKAYGIIDFRSANEWIEGVVEALNRNDRLWFNAVDAACETANIGCVGDEPVVAVQTLIQHHVEKEKQRSYEAHAEVFRLRSEVRGPEGFDTWKEAAVHERLERVKAERALEDVRAELEAAQKALLNK